LLYSPTRYLPPKLRVLIDYLVECLEKEPTLGKPGKSGGLSTPVSEYELPESEGLF
jgi:hypothetical protein